MGGSREGEGEELRVQMQPLQQLPNINTMREPPKGQVHGQKYSASPARIGFIIRPWHPSGEEVVSVFLIILQLLFLNWRNASLPCLLHIPLLCAHADTHTHTCTHKLICIWDVDYRGILFKNLEGPVLSGLSLQSTNSPLPLLLCLPVEKISKPYL